MDTESPRVGKDARAGKSIAADLHGSSRIPPEPQREPFAVVVAPGLWRGCDVLVEPPVAAHSLRHFRDHAEAMAFAEDLVRVTGWPLHDRTDSDG